VLKSKVHFKEIEARGQFLRQFFCHHLPPKM
jgi:hypothetical protein